MALSVTSHQEEEFQSHKEDKVICKSRVGHHNNAKIALSDRNSMYVHVLNTLKWHLTPGVRSLFDLFFNALMTFPIQKLSV